MAWIKRLPVWAGALLPLVTALVVQAVYTVASERVAADDGLEAKARALASLMMNVTGPNIAFEDDKAVADDLSHVAPDSDFAFAAAIRADGGSIAFHGDRVERSEVAALLVPESSAHVRRLEDLFVAAQPVVTDGKQVGTVFVGLRGDAAHASSLRRSEWASGISLAGIACAVIVVLLLARKIVQRSREMRVVLDNVDEALATIRLDGTLERECSAAFERWFGAPQAGPFWAQIAGDDVALREMLALGWRELVEGVMPLEVLVDQFPSRFTRDGKHFRIDIKPLLEGGALLRIRDVTVEVESQKTLAAQREYVAVFERALADPHGVREFIEDTGRLIAQLAAGCTDPSWCKRAVHTIKGTAAIYGVASVAEVAHRLEDTMVGETVPEPRALQELVTRWTAFASRVEHLLGSAAGRVDVARAELERLAELAELGSTAVADRLRGLTYEPVALRFDTVERQIARVAAAIDKPKPEVAIDAAGVRLAAERFRTFWGSLAHVIRNAVDHGIESPDERIAAGKPATGRIELDAKLDGNTVTIGFADDGRGIAWDAVRARALRAGVPAESHADLERALFRDGISTADSVTETSGRGLGLAAVQAAVDELGGRVAVTSEPGRGTRFCFSFPATPLRERPSRRFAVGGTPQEIVR